ncbi:hypothetical protein JCM19239_6819 [Vibrio variabilis]|uniref:Uncharacterized protein n=1 Tax=Vibrio variabilis TaxID=990271 RepID=A0ABQ0JN78_9VIBR|nr:hypothetical protein JCM19239_6819 [Vibrio variabilis]
MEIDNEKNKRDLLKKRVAQAFTAIVVLPVLFVVIGEYRAQAVFDEYEGHLVTPYSSLADVYCRMDHFQKIGFENKMKDKTEILFANGMIHIERLCRIYHS